MCVGSLKKNGYTQRIVLHAEQLKLYLTDWLKVNKLPTVKLIKKYNFLER